VPDWIGRLVGGMAAPHSGRSGNARVKRVKAAKAQGSKGLGAFPAAPFDRAHGFTGPSRMTLPRI